ncbi:rho GTPase-activating protein 24 isoform X1 [Hemicordylus capensis]|uniref:rho GTPase-activating protein 24 isoform X1 n=2 Tax=Hemicordylus capensis TaxID=884348 RepID=UPI00230367E7|nr:rho GTPase-activating protein 24 isoform X1 [Hemicordylus capensis]XP_053111919.1 rho GTPase-activating protein 24 isoform X1 [Hemicordylus capensis]XP_053111921.1 rho GTPase-activating protein 24 isoform X1 [Hemicordylus capensis]XP_053111922.1 rho GTPase-activating protein 24 isoform X1 [Hemicordylus capensis]XP_053111923.1 rho GTPase-activating protein 24 isoform X1 [Hemicordylus capensis]XP_053111924.1 rho GTPase-activating protein 24 isoform X1 [Hemicordylus capensis]XP_053111925.1 rh
MEEHNGSAESPQLSQGRHVAIKCGWLRKQGGFVKTWHTRWFVLKGEQLCYFKDEEETKPLGTIFLPGNRVIEHPCNDESPGKFLFEVIPGGDRERMTSNHETYLLMASTQNDMEDWVKSIRRVIWAPFGGGIFGQKLEDTVRYEKRYGNHLAPMLVEQCVDFIRLRGLKEEGLFRLPGQANLVKELQDAFDCGEKPLFDRNTDVHTVASLLKLYLRELPEPVIPYSKYEDFLSCAKLLSKEEEAGLNELVKQVKGLPLVNYNLLKYICRFLDEVQSYSGVNKMSVPNLATVFGPNILRPKVEDPLTIMEGTVVVQQLMSMMISEHELLFPKDADLQSGQEVCNNNNDVQKKMIIGQLQNKENNNTKESPVKRCSWDMPESPQRSVVDNGSPTAQPGSKSNSPRNSIHKLDVTRSPPLMVKKNPAFNKGSGIVTNGSFSSSVEGQEKTSPALPNGTLQSRRTSALKGPVTKMGTHSVQNGGVRMGISSTDTHSNSLNSRTQSWMPNGYVTLRDNKQKESISDSGQHHRLSTYDNVHQQFSVVNAEDKQSVDSATWSTSSCEISLPEHSNSCRSSTTTCPEQDFYGANFEDPVLDEAPQEDLSNQGDYESKGDRRSVGGRSSRATSSSDNSETFVVNNTSNHSALHSLVSSLKQEMAKQKLEYETRIKSLEQRNISLETEMMSLHDELEQEKKKFTMVEIKMRNAERAKDDAEKRNDMLQKEMEQFFSTFGELTVEPRRPERGNTIWIQ